MGNKFLYVILLGSIYLSREQLRELFPKKLDRTEYIQSKGICYQKKLCGVIYLAPWDPAGEQILPFIRSTLQNANMHKDSGLYVFVGNEREKGQSQLKAAEIGGGAQVDENDELGSRLGIKTYPNFMVIDSSGNTRHKDQEAMAWIRENYLEVKQAGY